MLVNILLYLIYLEIFCIFCCLCLQNLPSALSTYDNVNEVCSSMKKSLKSVEISLSNRFGRLSDQVSELSSKFLEFKSEVSKNFLLCNQYNINYV